MIGPQMVQGYSNAAGWLPLTTMVSRRISIGTDRDPGAKYSDAPCGSTITRSPVSAYASVKPHATLPLEPATITGTPGSVTPVILRPGYSSDARYQILGTP